MHTSIRSFCTCTYRNHFLKKSLYTTIPKFSYSSSWDKGFSPYERCLIWEPWDGAGVGKEDLELSEWFLE